MEQADGCALRRRLCAISVLSIVSDIHMLPSEQWSGQMHGLSTRGNAFYFVQVPFVRGDLVTNCIVLRFTAEQRGYRKS
jgi:hypothetical protein